MSRDPHQPMNPWPQTFTCPVCGRTSWNPNDARERYCGACHGFTEEPPPPGFRWVVFHAQDGAMFGRLLEERFLEVGNRYELVGEGGVYVFDGTAFAELER